MSAESSVIPARPPRAGTRRSRAARASAGRAARRCAGSAVRPNISTGDAALVGGQVELDRLRASARGCARRARCRPRSGGCGRRSAGCVGCQRLVGAEAEDGVLLAQRDEAAQPAQQRRRRAQLGLDVDRLVAVDRVHERRRVELREVGAARSRRCGRRSTASGCGRRRGRRGRRCRPSRSRRRSRGPGEPGSENRIACSSSISSRPSSSSGASRRRMPDVELHARVLRVLRVHVVALLVGDHLERQLVVVAQEQAPLAVVGDVAACCSRIS